MDSVAWLPRLPSTLHQSYSNVVSATAIASPANAEMKAR